MEQVPRTNKHTHTRTAHTETHPRLKKPVAWRALICSAASSFPCAKKMPMWRLAKTEASQGVVSASGPSSKCTAIPCNKPQRQHGANSGTEEQAAAINAIVLFGDEVEGSNGVRRFITRMHQKHQQQPLPPPDQARVREQVKQHDAVRCSRGRAQSQLAAVTAEQRSTCQTTPRAPASASASAGQQPPFQAEGKSRCTL